jgi:hypothetical protein
MPYSVICAGWMGLLLAFNSSFNKFGIGNSDRSHYQFPQLSPLPPVMSIASRAKEPLNLHRLSVCQYLGTFRSIRIIPCHCNGHIRCRCVCQSWGTTRVSCTKETRRHVRVCVSTSLHVDVDTRYALDTHLVPPITRTAFPSTPFSAPVSHLDAHVMLSGDVFRPNQDI